jgi:ABC-type Mn2+/Zn2+ transport system ATPase subunit
MSSASPALVARGLTVRYGDRVALDEVSFEAPAGASVAVLGPNGAGKSTLFAAAVGLVKPSSGTIERQGGVAFVPQRLHLDASFPVTVRDVVAMGRYPALGMLRRFEPADRAAVEDAMGALRIEHLASRRFGLLSGGERQRALLAQAVAQDPGVLLLDEPFTGVDAPTRRDLHALIGSWRDDGRTVLVATHDLESASSDYDLVLCLNRRVVAFGPADLARDEEVLAATFAGHVVRVGELIVDTAHHHHGAS